MKQSQNHRQNKETHQGNITDKTVKNMPNNRQHRDKTKKASQTRERNTSQHHRPTYEKRSQNHRQTHENLASTIDKT